MAKKATKKKAPHWNKLADPTEGQILKAVACVRKGNFRYVARQFIGISDSLWRSWMRTGKKDLQLYQEGAVQHRTAKAELYHKLEQAEADNHMTIIQNVMDSEDPKLQFEYLQRRYNKLYSKNPNAHIDDESGEEVKVSGAEVLAQRLGELFDP